MKSRKIFRKCMSLLLLTVLLFSMAPTAFAADAPWANDAVETLNDIYGSGTFSGDQDTNVTVDEMITLLTDRFHYPDDSEIITEYLDTTDSELTRLQLAQVVCSVYGLAEASEEEVEAMQFEDCEDPFVVTLRKTGITDGYVSGNFGPADPVTEAELSVIFYRTLRSIGAASADEESVVVPGEYGYDEFMYLATRNCVGNLYEIDPDTSLAEAIVVVVDEPCTGENILDAWHDRLESFDSLNEEYGEDYDERPWFEYLSGDSDVTLREAVIATVEADRDVLPVEKQGIFSDVPPASPFYDGVMYLFRNGIVRGDGNGHFDPEGQLIRAHLAALLCHVNGINTDDPVDDISVSDMVPEDDFYSVVTHALNRNYMTYTNSETFAFSPGSNLTRQEAALAVFSSYVYDPQDVNLSVLDRFSDKGDIDAEYRTAMAYLVSAGIISGTSEGKLFPAMEANRATFGMLLARVMMGLDASKMHDYDAAVQEVLQ